MESPSSVLPFSDQNITYCMYLYSYIEQRANTQTTKGKNEKQVILRGDTNKKRRVKEGSKEGEYG
jgi:hypothetical protein